MINLQDLNKNLPTLRNFSICWMLKKEKTFTKGKRLFRWDFNAPSVGRTLEQTVELQHRI